MKTILWSGLMSLLLTFGAVLLAEAQCGTDYLWPSDGAQKAKAEESFVRLKDSKTNGNFKEAVPFLQWLINTAPQLNKTLYIYGAEVYDGLAKKETDAAKKTKYADSLLLIYDLRLKNTPCGEEASIANRKALAAYPYYINSDKVKDLFQLMDKSLELNGNDIMDGTIIPYMQAACISKTKFKTLTDEQIIERYEKITEVIKAKIKKAQSEGKPVDKYHKYQSDVDNIFANCGVVIDCNLVKKTLEPRRTSRERRKARSEISGAMINSQFPPSPSTFHLPPSNVTSLVFSAQDLQDVSNGDGNPRAGSESCGS